MTVTDVTIGPARAMLGDCIMAMAKLPDGSVDLVLTDPPYCSGATREAGRARVNKTMTRGAHGVDQWFGADSLTTAGLQHLLRLAAIEWRRVLKPGGHVLCFTDWRMSDAMAAAIESADLHRGGLVVWDKVHFGLGQAFRLQHEFILHFSKGKGAPPQNHSTPNVLHVKPVRDGLHPTEKPQDLLRRLIETLCPPGGVVLDPFAGSLATALAAASTGRRAVVIERDERYFAAGLDRLRNNMPVEVAA